MALSIKDEETDRMVRRYAALKQTSFTGAIRMAVGEALERETPGDETERRSADFRVRVREIQDRVARLKTCDTRTDDEILGYDEHGLPA